MSLTTDVTFWQQVQLKNNKKWLAKLLTIFIFYAKSFFLNVINEIKLNISITAKP